MTHTYKLTGMTCPACEEKVKSALLSFPDIAEVKPHKSTDSVTVTMNQHVGLSSLQSVLGKKYMISAMRYNETGEETKSWYQTYKPVFLIFAYITLITFLIQRSNNQFNVMEWMRHFMAGFFLVFSFFKLLNLNEFAQSYAKYDLVAKLFPGWGFVYAFIELALGLAFVVDFNPFIVNSIAFIIMSVSLIGVLQSVFNKEKIRCACLGTIFNVPMSTVTILEDVLMIVMSAIMLVMM